MKPRKGGLVKPEPYKHTKSGGAVGDPSMAEGDAFDRGGAGVSENVKEVGAMPNESVMHSEDKNHLR